jgi:hypothetical protein
MSYERMLKTELELTEEINALLTRAAEADASEDVRFGEGQRDEDLPEELRRREKRLATIREAKGRLEAEAAETRARKLREQAAAARECAESAPDAKDRKRAANRAAKRMELARELAPTAAEDDLEPPKTGDGLPMHEPKATTEGKPHAKAQMGFTDADSRIMESGGAFVQGYNCQAAVDEDHQIIVGQAISNLSPDNGALIPVLEQVVQNCGRSATVTTADAGYWHQDAEAACAQLGTEAYISTRRRKHGSDDEDEPSEEPSTAAAAARSRMQAKLSTDEGRRAYARRKATVEPVFGQIKEARRFRRFLLRGMENVQAEWALVCVGHNLLKLWRSGAMQLA